MAVGEEREKGRGKGNEGETSYLTSSGAEGCEGLPSDTASFHHCRPVGCPFPSFLGRASWRRQARPGLGFGRSAPAVRQAPAERGGSQRSGPPRGKSSDRRTGIGFDRLGPEEGSSRKQGELGPAAAASKGGKLRRRNDIIARSPPENPKLPASQTSTKKTLGIAIGKKSKEGTLHFCHPFPQQERKPNSIRIRHHVQICESQKESIYIFPPFLSPFLS